MIVAQVFFEDINNEKNKEIFKNYLRGRTFYKSHKLFCVKW